MVVSNNNSTVGLIYAPYIPKPELICEPGKVFGKPYHTIRPVFFGTEGEMEILAWCQQTFGEEGRLGASPRWFLRFDTFWFRDEADSVWFLLRWS